jgi:hypothetical protein
VIVEVAGIGRRTDFEVYADVARRLLKRIEGRGADPGAFQRVFRRMI